MSAVSDALGRGIRDAEYEIASAETRLIELFEKQRRLEEQIQQVKADLNIAVEKRVSLEAAIGKLS